MDRKSRHIVRSIILYTLLFFVSFNVIFLWTACLYHISANDLKKEQLISTEIQLLSSAQKTVAQDIDTMANDLIYLQEITATFSIKENNNDVLLDILSEFLTYHQTYDKIHYLNNNGNEIMQVSFNSNHNVIISMPSELSPLYKDDIFEKTINLDPGKIYLSPLFLEMSGDTVLTPYKPIMRMSMPIYAYQDEAEGIIVIDYLGSNVITDYYNIMQNSPGEMLVVDENANWIVNTYEPETEWLFLLDDETNHTMSNDYPDAWTILNENEGLTGSFQTDEGYFIYAQLTSAYEYPDQESSDLEIITGSYFLITFIPIEYSGSQLFYMDREQLITDTIKQQYIIIILSVLGSIFIAVLITAKNVSNNQIKYYSSHDSMTDMMNRRSGLHLLNKAFDDALSIGKTFSICFMDIDGLKDVNDTFGHEMGDTLISAVTDVLHQNLRKYDFVARMGGDEFLIYLHDTDAPAAEKVWLRIKQAYSNTNQTDKYPFLISVSHGITSFDPNNPKTAEELIHDADAKMYEEKRFTKETIRIIK